VYVSRSRPPAHAAAGARVRGAARAAAARARQPVNVIVNNNPPMAQPMPCSTSTSCSTQPRAQEAEGRLALGAASSASSSWATLGLTGASEATKDELVPSMPLGGAALVLSIIMIPVTASGGTSARRGTDLRGVVPLRVLGWVFYAGMIVTGVVTISLAAATEKEPPDGLIMSIGGVAALSYLFFAIDDFVSFAQARGWRTGSSAARRASRSPSTSRPS
jgi:hypothetical protein